MTVLKDTGFESASVAAEFDATTDTDGRLQLVTSGVFRGSKAFRDPGSAGANTAFGQYTVAGLPLKTTFRFAMKLGNLPGVNALIFNNSNGAKSIGCRVSSLNKLQILVGGTAQSTSTAFVAGTWYIVQGWCDLTTDPPKLHARLYDSSGVAIDAEISNDAVAGAVTGVQSFRFGNLTASTSLDITFDSFKATDGGLADYPLGMPADDPAAAASQMGARHGIVFNPTKGLYLPA